MSSLRKAMVSSTLGEPRRMRPMVVWSVLEALFKGTPYSVLALAVIILLLPLLDASMPLEWWQIVGVEISFVVGMFFYVLIAHKAYDAVFTDAYKITTDGRLRLVAHMRRLPMGYYNSKDPGEIGEYLAGDYTQTEFLITHFIPQAISGFFVPLLTLIFFAFLNWKMALVALSVIVLAYPIFLVSGHILTKLGKRFGTVKRNTSSRMIEYLLGIKLIKAFNLGGTSFVRLEKAVRELKQESIRMELLPAPVLSLAKLLLHGGSILLALVGFWFLQHWELSLLYYVIFLLGGLGIYSPLIESLEFNALVQFLSLSSDRIYDLMQEPKQSEGTVTEVASTDITFQNVSFRYNKKPVLEDISLRIPAKSFVALVGPSGSGKTTLTRLLARFWDPTAGTITLGGRDLREYTLDTLLSRIAVVFQDVYLFKDTVRNNILMGRENATEAEVERAARLARCHDFIMQLPNGYETEIGEGGNTLSGGEKQRISIARAILKDAPIVLLDEATASLDPENEVHIQDAISQLVQEKTVVVIAHRLWTVREADCIYVLERGRLVQQGKHEALLSEEGGVYRHLWDEQQRTKGWKF